uniref:Uncharacterized protein n=1 Tax=Rhizophora mucronata TaxID=61149 RepID=A0A2P2KMQ0_RHIMU
MAQKRKQVNGYIFFFFSFRVLFFFSPLRGSPVLYYDMKQQTLFCGNDMQIYPRKKDSQESNNLGIRK